MAQRLCFDERTRIEVMSEAGLSVAEMADRLGRCRSTVYRELGGGGGCDGYRAGRAHRRAGVDAARPKVHKLAGDAVLAGEVAEGLKLRWSPHAISADLHTRGMAVCAETIYRACYANNNTSGLKAGSWQSLPRGRRRRKPRSRCETAKRSALGPYRPLTQRPQQADDRSEPGHWEGDLMIGANNASAIATLVERVSRLTLVVPLPHGYSADNVTRAVTAAFGRQPAEMAKTLTWDQGSEMARWADIEHNCNIEVFFCQARSPWQRPSNEQTNGLLRRWLPKSTNLNLNPIQLALIQDNLNHMPRKLHNWNSAQHTDHHGRSVATTSRACPRSRFQDRFSRRVIEQI